MGYNLPCPAKSNEKKKQGVELYLQYGTPYNLKEETYP